MAYDILIVDDEADIRMLTAGILEDEGYQTSIAANSDAALAALESGPPPALLILDIWLQGSTLDGMELLRNLPEIALSLGSACTSAVPAPSRMLRAIGVTAELAGSSIRFGVGRFNLEEEIRQTAHRVTEVVRKLRASKTVEPDSDEADDSCLLGAEV